MKKIMNANAVITLAVLAVAKSAHALTPMIDNDMSDVSAQSGITASYTESASGIGLSSMAILQANPNAATIDEVGEKGIRLIGPSSGAFLKRLDTSRPMLNAMLDVGTANVGASTGVPIVALNFDWARSRILLDGIRMAGSPTASLGRYAVDGSSILDVKAVRGLEWSNPDYGSSVMLGYNGVNPSQWAVGNMGNSTPGAIYWRYGAGNSELTLGDFSFYFKMQDGRLGVNASEGVRLESKPGTKVAFSLSIDFMYDAAGASPFAVTTADRSLLYWGWRGNWSNFVFSAKTGGRIDGSSQGLNAAVRFDYDPDFVWIIGDGRDGRAASTSGENAARLEFGNWTKINNSEPAFNIPYIGLESVTGSQGTYGLCWGSAAVSVTANGACSGSGTGAVAASLATQKIAVRSAADPDAIAITVRDMRLNAYSTTVDVLDRTVNLSKPVVSYNWGLIYSFADLDADIFVSPRADNSLDVRLALTTQTLQRPSPSNAPLNTVQDRWTYGTNFMIADTETPANSYAIGLMGADVLMAMTAGRMTMSPSGIVTDSTNMRYQIRGLLGGGKLPDMPVPQAMTYVDLNLEADRYQLILGPAPSGNSALVYSGFINLANLNTAIANQVPGSGNHAHDDGTYFSLAEPNLSKLDVDFRFANITGPLAIRNGKVDLQGDSDSTFRLLISNDIDVGTTAIVPCTFGVACTPTAATNPLRVQALEFGGKNLATLVMPSGTIRSQITLMPQVP